MKCSDSLKSVRAKRNFVAKQTQEASSTGNVTLRNCGDIRTGTIAVWEAYRCLYCGEYFNQAMAEDHFGMTRKQYFRGNPRKQKNFQKLKNTSCTDL